MDTRKIRPGQTITYDDGRRGHRGVLATVLAVSSTAMTVQFEDRADTTIISFSDLGWMDHLEAIDDQSGI